MNALRSIGACAVSASLLALLAVPELASAQAARTWVSAAGNDANACSRAAPCRTFQGAHDKTTAGGEINCLDSGDFLPLGIAKAITIDCKGVLAGLAVGPGDGIVIAAPGGQIVLRNLEVSGAGSNRYGIRVLDAASVHIENVTVHGGGAGIVFEPGFADSQLTLVRVLSRDNSLHGLWVAPFNGHSAKVSVFDSTFVGNTLTGILVQGNGITAITNSVASGNGTHGIAARANGFPPSTMSLDRVTSSSNGTSGVLADAAVIYLSNVLLTGNAYGLYPPLNSGSYVSFGNNRTVGNTTSNGSPTTVASQF